LEPPTTGDCTVLIAWQIESGDYNGTNLDGFNVVLAAHSPGNMIEVDWKVALYVDNRANDAQQEALTLIFSGQAGGHFAGIAQHVGEVMGVSSADIEYKSQGKDRSVNIKGVGHMDIRGLDGMGGADVTITNNALGVVPDEPTVVAKSSSLTYQDYGMDWNLSGKNGYYSGFTYKGG